MKLRNLSARPHWLGDVLIAPGATADVDPVWKGAFNTAELEEVREDEVVIEESKVVEVKRGRKAKAAQ